MSDPNAVNADLLGLVVAAKGPIGSLGGAWMSAPEEEEATVAAGLEGWQLYFLGRHGVFSNSHPDVVAAAAYAFPTSVVRSEWNAALRVLTAADCVDRYLDLCHSWGRKQLVDFAGNARLIELSQRIIDAADATALPLFAGWRALPLPSDEPAQAVHVLQLLREHRGACHGVALAALRMNPLTAILTNEGGAANAEEYGWPKPYPDVSDEDRALLTRVERLTDEIAAPPYGALSTAEQQEFLELLNAASARAFS